MMFSSVIGWPAPFGRANLLGTLSISDGIRRWTGVGNERAGLISSLVVATDLGQVFFSAGLVRISVVNAGGGMVDLIVARLMRWRAVMAGSCFQ